MLKIALVVVKNVFFDVKKGICELLHWITQKHTAYKLSNLYDLWFITSLHDTANDVDLSDNCCWGLRKP